MHRHDRQALLEVAIVFVLLALLLGVAALLSGCSLSLAQRPPTLNAEVMRASVDPAQCAAIDRAHLGWTVGGLVAGGLGGSTALVGLIPSTAGRDAALGTAAGLSLFAGVAAALSARDAARYTADGCGAVP